MQASHVHVYLYCNLFSSLLVMHMHSQFLKCLHPVQGFHYGLGSMANGPAVRLILPGWFDHLEEGFHHKEAQSKKYSLQ